MENRTNHSTWYAGNLLGLFAGLGLAQTEQLSFYILLALFIAVTVGLKKSLNLN